jgi:hypothetical protein
MKILNKILMATLLVALSSGLVWAQTIQITVPLSGAQQVLPVATPGVGTGTLTVNLATGAMSGSVTFSGLTSPTTAGHIHQGAAGINGPVVFPLSGGVGVTAGTMTLPAVTLFPVQMVALRNNELYINIHTLASLGGEIRGQIIFPAASGSTDRIMFVDVVSGDFDPARPGFEMVALDTEGRIFISFDLATWMQVPGMLMKLLSGDFNGDGRDDIAGIGEEGDIFFTCDFGASWMEIPSPEI